MTANNLVEDTKGQKDDDSTVDGNPQDETVQVGGRKDEKREVKEGIS